MFKLMLSPHNDDETLFAGLIAADQKPDLLIVVFDSFIQGQRYAGAGDRMVRRDETLRAMRILSPTTRVAFLEWSDLIFAGGSEKREHIAEVDWQVQVSNLLVDLMFKLGNLNVDREVELLIAPLPELQGHIHHNLVGEAAVLWWDAHTRTRIKRLIQYATYRRGFGRSRHPPTYDVQPIAILKKLRALAHYESQILDERLDCVSWFTDCLIEHAFVHDREEK